MHLELDHTSQQKHTSNVVGSNVDDDTAGLEPLALDELGFADGGHDNVGSLELKVSNACSGNSQ